MYHISKWPQGRMRMKEAQFRQYISEVIKEIEKHKWYESEKAGHNIGGNTAALDWLSKHYERWKENAARRLFNEEQSA